MNMDSRGGFINNFMFFQNTTISLKMKIENTFLLLKNPSDGTVVEIIDTKKIYKCAIWYNIVPFATDRRDNSWCGIGFP